MATLVQSRGSAMAEINITPLVDVMLVLLIIFMVAAPMLETGKVFTTSQVPPDRVVEPMRLQVEAGDVFVLDGQALSLSQLDEQLAAVARTQPERGLLLSVHPDSEFQSLANALSVARHAGVDKISLPSSSR